ncbi:hypothetical protein K1719_003474 [Acacia pycnantha]|nr:hypothetical protein K1719_003474 [Acacia pycnantha]
MVYSYTPAYYSTLQDSITSLCKTILPFSFKKRCLPASELKQSKLQSDNLKWQQDSFHHILNLMGLHKEEIVAEYEVVTFRTNLLEKLIASPPDHEHPAVLRDKLLFLQELLYAKCISEEEYHSSKRPLLQRLAVQGAEIEARDVIVSGSKESSEEEWSVIDLKDEQSLMNKENVNSKNKSKNIKGASSVFSFVSAYKPGKNKTEKSIFESPSLGMDSKGKQQSSIFMEEVGPPESTKEESSVAEKLKRKPFKSLFQKEQRDGGPEATKKHQWGFEGFKKWKKSESEDETPSSQATIRTLGEGPDTKLIKKKLHSDGSPSDFFIDKVLGEKIKKELSRIQTELSTTNPSLQFSNDQMEEISTKLPVDKAELKNYFPKSWCDKYGDVVLEVVKKEFKEHVGDMEIKRSNAREKHSTNSKRWTNTFDEEGENFHPNLFANHHQDHNNNPFRSSNINPFSHSKWN